MGHTRSTMSLVNAEDAPARLRHRSMEKDGLEIPPSKPSIDSIEIPEGTAALYPYPSTDARHNSTERLDLCLNPTDPPTRPIIDRPVVRWPNNARVALWVAPNIEFKDFMPEPNFGQSFYRTSYEPDATARRHDLRQPRLRQPGLLMAHARGLRPAQHQVYRIPPSRRLF